MAIADLLRGIGTGVEKGAKAAGAVLEPLAKRTAEVVSGEAPQIDEEQRQRGYKAQDEQLAQRRDWLQRQLELDQKYQTLTPEQRQQLNQEYQTLGQKAPDPSIIQKLHQVMHPGGSTYQTPAKFTGDATPAGGTAAVDEENAEKLAAARYHARPTSPNAQYFDSYAQSLGLPDSSQMTPEQWESAIAGQKKAGRAPTQHHWAPVKFNGNLYMHDPATNEMKFVGAENDVTVHRGVQNVTQADGTILQIPVTTYTSKQSGKPITDEDGNPIQSLEPDNHPANPSSGETKPKNAQAGPPGEAKPGKVLPKVPTAGAAPVTPKPPVGKVVGSHGSPLLKSDQAQYTKVAEDANGATEALASATEAMKAPTASSDQDLIYSWVRSNVMGAGRMTQAEFKQAAQIGSLPQKAQTWWSMTLTGRLSPEIEKMMFADIQRSTTAKQAEAKKLRDQVQQDMNPGATPAAALPPPSSGAVENWVRGPDGKLVKQ
jgi:hypothetical protein